MEARVGRGSRGLLGFLRGALLLPELLVGLQFEAALQQAHIDLIRGAHEASGVSLDLRDQGGLVSGLGLDQRGQEELAVDARQHLALRVEHRNQIIVVLDARSTHLQRREEGLARAGMHPDGVETRQGGLRCRGCHGGLQLHLCKAVRDWRGGFDAQRSGRQHEVQAREAAEHRGQHPVHGEAATRTKPNLLVHKQVAQPDAVETGERTVDVRDDAGRRSGRGVVGSKEGGPVRCSTILHRRGACCCWCGGRVSCRIVRHGCILCDDGHGALWRLVAERCERDDLLIRPFRHQTQHAALTTDRHTTTQQPYTDENVKVRSKQREMARAPCLQGCLCGDRHDGMNALRSEAACAVLSLQE